MLYCATAGAAGAAGQTLGFCFTTLWGCCSTWKSCSPASSPALRSGAELSTEEKWDKRRFCQSLVPILWQLAGTLHVLVVPGLCSHPLLAEMGSRACSLTCSFHHKCFSSIQGLQDILQLLVPMEEISTMSSVCLLQTKPGCFLRADRPTAEFSAEPQMLHPWAKGKHGFSMCWDHQLMSVQLAANTSPCFLLV